MQDKVGVQKPNVFLYTSNEQLKMKYLKYCLNSIQNTKYLGINLPKYVHDLYTESYKTYLRKNLKDLNKWRNIPCFGLEDSIFLRC